VFWGSLIRRLAGVWDFDGETVIPAVESTDRGNAQYASGCSVRRPRPKGHLLARWWCAVLLSWGPSPRNAVPTKDLPVGRLAIA